jgi:hypothetical protein
LQRFFKIRLYTNIYGAHIARTNFPGIYVLGKIIILKHIPIFPSKNQSPGQKYVPKMAKPDLNWVAGWLDIF